MDLNKRLADAIAQKREIEDAIRSEKYAVERSINDKYRSINDKYRDALSVASKAVFAAEQAIRDNIDKTASHPWDGKRVFRMVKQFRRWSSKPIGETREEGIVEVVRQSSDFPENMRWSRPRLGDVIVRKLKKDGSVSKQFFETRNNVEFHWSLAE